MTSLPKPRQVALDKIAQRSREQKQEWVPTDDIDPRPLNALEAAHFIVQMKQDGNRLARVTQDGWAQIVQMEQDGQAQAAAERHPPAPVPDLKPMEATEPDARRPNGNVLLGPFPKRAPLSPVTSLTGNPAPALREPDEPPVAVQPQPVAPPPAVNVEPPVEPDCPDCIHADILNIVSVMYPEIADTVDILTRAKHIERDLLKARGNGRHPE